MPRRGPPSVQPPPPNTPSYRPEPSGSGSSAGSGEPGARNLSRAFPAVDTSVPAARLLASDFAQRAGAVGDVVDRVRLAVSEAVTNVVKHAYRGAPGELQLSLAVCDDELWTLVSDDGCGHQVPAYDPGLGLGLALMAEACDEFTVTERAGGGTEVQMRFQLKGSRTADGA